MAIFFLRKNSIFLYLIEYDDIKYGQPIQKEMFYMIIPIWVYAVVIGIFISAMMAIKTGREERQLESDSIEKEGEIYMNRLEKEKEKRSEQEVNGF
jgi:hypothetical protein